jgi:LssY C-terminus
MFKPIQTIIRLLTVVWRPQPDERPFLDRAQTRDEANLSVTVAALSIRESERFFGVRMAKRDMQPVWIDVVNHSDKTWRLDLVSLDPGYYTPLEAAYVNHYSVGKRLLSYGLLGWMFLPLVPLIPFKIIGARIANRRINDYFKQHGFRNGPIRAGTERSGFAFISLDEGTKTVNLRLIAPNDVWYNQFSCDVPGLDIRQVQDEPVDAGELTETNEETLRAWLLSQPKCTTNKWGTVDGDPLNLVVVGDRATVLQCFGARWDEAESITFATCWKTARAFVFSSEYRYSPVSPLYYLGRSEDLALQKARAIINERMHLRLWRTMKSYEGKEVWIGQVSRDIGVRFTFRTWNLTTHTIDEDVDEARDYVIDYLMSTGHVGQVGYVGGVGAAPASAPRRNMTGDKYYTDGLRAVLVLSLGSAKASFLSWASNGDSSPQA